ncbi:putative methyltransferase [Actinoplanes missouriensis 431]|uniref:Putative methyltransferase n=1 Tax=Actinoplanes missouriensis (strain ATCC 14538 / DSM 43046 / CBS 188.64 / JCM 3121 / NBRC 102363 / NCIMB 12654 / NRRL B-3342 / UNCC 431) TaxID=512565 RepID=I0HFR7_ACTM4|nr:precorrin-6A synthase (deacetylating) [Actinoplanes missouriensis]BAL91854.1 putative methyltransferase [Actinoplanes missouriensis 431]
MRKIYVIGIGAGDPDHLTLQAAKAIGRTNVFFLIDKGEAKQSLVDLRERIIRAYSHPHKRIVEGRDPDRDRTPADYTGTIADWRHRRSQVFEELISEHLREDEIGAFLVWGDPSLYDSTIAILDEILERGEATFEYEVIPGISSVSALAAKHRVGLNRVGQPFQITTGRRLAEGWPEGVDDVVVMLDAQQAFTAHPEAEIYWGAYVSTEDELLASGRVADVAEEIVKTRAEARERHGWIMDTYLLRRRPTTDD